MTEENQRMVFCQKYQQELPGLSSPPLPGEFGQKVFEGISQKAWEEWMGEQTKIINELNLKVFEPQAQQTLQEHAQKFLFEGAGSIHTEEK